MDGHAEVLDWREIADFDELEPLARKFNINAVGIDNEPEYNPAVNLPSNTFPVSAHFTPPLYS
jgi:hypothetical protein